MTARPQPRDDLAPSSEAILQHLAQLLRTPARPASPRRRKLLAYVVEQWLAGRADRLKASDLAVAVLGRDERFDPQNDPIVRIEVGRLRRDLDHYYADFGSRDPIRIAIPKGHYVPTFEIGGPSAPPAVATAAPRLRRLPGWLLGAVAMLCVILLGVAVWHWANGTTGTQVQRAGPAVLVLPFRALGGSESDQLLAGGLTADLIADLMRFDGIEVYAGQSPTEGTVKLPAAVDAGFAYVVTGIVEPAPGRVRVTASLSEHASGRVIWSQSYDRALSTDDVFSACATS